MKKSVPQKIVEKVRNITPLAIRQKIGPILGYLYYIERKYVGFYGKNPKILSIEKTIDLITEKNLSMIRFGDGEISIIDGENLPFQRWDKDLAKRLEETIKVHDDRLLICIPGMWEDVNIFVDYAHRFVIHNLYRDDHVWREILSYDTTYGDTNVTRHYLGYKDKHNAGIIFKKIFNVWDGKDVLLIEGSKSRLGVGNDMFDSTRSLKRILCPPENAYSHYETIKKEALKINKETLILLSLGPTAKVLAYDLFLLGYRVLDIGHIDMEYEMFLRKELRQVKVAHKYFNEINERDPEDCNDEKYLHQIIATIE